MDSRKNDKKCSTEQNQIFKIVEDRAKSSVVVVVVVGYPTPSEGWGHDGRPWIPTSRATPQGLDQRS